MFTQTQMFANIQFSILHTSGCSHGAATQDTCTIQPPPQTTLLYSQHIVPWHSDKLASYIFEEIIIPPHPHPSHATCSSKSRTVYYKPVQIFKSFEIVVHLTLGLAKPLYFIMFFSNATTCPLRLRGLPPRLWLKCNRLLKLGRQVGVVTLPRWEWWWNERWIWGARGVLNLISTMVTMGVFPF